MVGLVVGSLGKIIELLMSNIELFFTSKLVKHLLRLIFTIAVTNDGDYDGNSEDASQN
jgi:hypothetical protein